MTVLTSRDPEPSLGTIVRDDLGRLWIRFDVDGRNWAPVEDDDDIESWTKVAGNYGPVTVVRSFTDTPLAGDS